MALLHIAEQSDWETAQQAGVYDRSTRGASISQVGYRLIPMGGVGVGV